MRGTLDNCLQSDCVQRMKLKVSSSNYCGVFQRGVCRIQTYTFQKKWTCIHVWLNKNSVFSSLVSVPLMVCIYTESRSVIQNINNSRETKWGPFHFMSNVLRRHFWRLIVLLRNSDSFYTKIWVSASLSLMHLGIYCVGVYAWCVHWWFQIYKQCIEFLLQLSDTVNDLEVSNVLADISGCCCCSVPQLLRVTQGRYVQPYLYMYKYRYSRWGQRIACMTVSNDPAM